MSRGSGYYLVVQSEEMANSGGIVFEREGIVPFTAPDSLTAVEVSSKPLKHFFLIQHPAVWNSCRNANCWDVRHQREEEWDMSCRRNGEGKERGGRRRQRKRTLGKQRMRTLKFEVLPVPVKPWMLRDRGSIHTISSVHGAFHLAHAGRGGGVHVIALACAGTVILPSPGPPPW